MIRNSSPRSFQEWGVLRLEDDTWRSYREGGRRRGRAAVCEHVHPTHAEAATCLDEQDPFADWGAGGYVGV